MLNTAFASVDYSIQLVVKSRMTLVLLTIDRLFTSPYHVSLEISAVQIKDTIFMWIL